MIQMTQLLKADSSSIAAAASLLRQGQLVAFPTETVYGLGANALDAQAVLSIFAAKGRPADNPLIVHVAEIEDLEPLCQVTDLAKQLMAAFWPGPLTLLLKKKSVVPMEVTAGLDTVAVRMPSHPVAHQLLAACRVPVAAPSANRSGKPSPTLAQHVWDDMNGRIPMILDGGSCQVGVESTVLDVTCNPPCILRPGGVTKEMLETVLPEVTVAGSVLRPLEKGEKALSPGMRYQHYAPQGELTLVSGSDEKALPLMNQLYDEALARGESCCLMVFEETLSAVAGRRAQSLGQHRHPEQMAERLFDLLRQMDKLGVARIYSQVVDPHGLGLAIMNRLGRAAAFHVIDAEDTL
ncbi:MAG: threonylcarbamoyl-AMP synthase [Clostridia bacterium]|nr:threonylcarbamoyl-AMP synthase [Clostridia bacterium]